MGYVNGRGELAFALYNKTEHPKWLYMAFPLTQMSH